MTLTNITTSAVPSAEKALEVAARLRDGGDIPGCVRLCVIVAEEMKSLMDNYDDSNGYAGRIFEAAIELLASAADRLPEGHPGAGDIFRAIIRHADSKIYDGWSDWRLGLLAACGSLCGTPELRYELEAYCLRLRDTKSDWSDRYLHKGVQKIALALITRFDGPERADEFIEQNLDNSSFRKIALEKALLENNLERALDLCLDGEHFDADYLGLTAQWIWSQTLKKRSAGCSRSSSFRNLEGPPAGAIIKAFAALSGIMPMLAGTARQTRSSKPL